jgi:DNA helicase-2/ATP-dependent DNA helicase PcrA
MKYFDELINDDSEASLIHYAHLLLKKKYRQIHKQILQFQWIDAVAIFKSLLQTYILTNEAISEVITLDEVVILVLTRHWFIEKIETVQMKYVFIDEVQDYTPAQIYLLSEFFPKAKFTMVGDENQAIFNSTISFEQIAQQFANRQSVVTYPLLYSYRSTGAITQLFNQLTNQEITIIPVRPMGKIPQYCQ